MASPHSPQQDVTTFRETEVRHAESAPEPDGCCGYQSVEVADDESFDPCVGDGSKENNDTVAPPAWWRTAIAVVTTSFFDEALVSYHVSNLVTEMQSERECHAPPRRAHARVQNLLLTPTPQLLPSPRRDCQCGAARAQKSHAERGLCD